MPFAEERSYTANFAGALYTKLTDHFITLKNLSLYKLVSYNEIVTIFRRNKLIYIWNINK